MHSQATRLWVILLLVLTESCLVSVLVSMEQIVIATNGTNSTGERTAVKLCWSWGADGSGKDCPMDLVFSEIVLVAIALTACLLPSLMHCLKQRGAVHHNTCLCPFSAGDALCYFLPLFFSLIAFLVGVVFLGVVIEDNRDTILLPGNVDLSYEMIYEKPWRIGLISMSCLFCLLACIFAGILAGKWRTMSQEQPGHLQSRPLLRTRNERSTLKSSLFVADL